jgi:hypothetical protein
LRGTYYLLTHKLTIFDWIVKREAGNRVSTCAVDRDMVIELARAVVVEVAPDEVGLFPERCRAYFRKWGGHGKDPLSMGVEAWASVATFAALSTAQSVLLFIAVEFKKGVEEEGASTIRAWVKRGFRRLGPADADTADEEAKPAADPLSREQLALVRDHAYQQAIKFKMTPGRAEKMADTIVARLVLRGRDG